MAESNVKKVQQMKKVNRMTLIIAGVLLMGLAVLYYIDPKADGFIPCAVYQLTGLYCAGCGTARALHALLHGHIAEAFSQNALTIVLLPPVALYIVASSMGYTLKGKTIVVLGVIIMVVSAIFTILRNIPSPMWDFLRP